MDFAVPVDQRENEMIDKFLDLALDQIKKKLWNMKEMVRPIVVNALGTLKKKNLKESQKESIIRKSIETICTTALLRLARILRRVLKNDLQLTLV